MSARSVEPTILPVMVGCAGHVDHGKTSLVKLLTGCDTDRLKEEKARGLSIDLGFAPCRLPGNRLVGIVDVPGHEDFIRNMVAGAASMDILMLVVAADDGVMPQTVEHLRIVRLLRAARVLAVVTKIDLVEPEMRALVVEELADFLARAGFPDAPVLPASNVTFDGIQAVRDALRAMVEEACRAPDDRAFRMYVERAFSIKGYGTVVTGIPTSGRAGAGDALDLHPPWTRHAVRAVQSYKVDGQAAMAGACAAVNLRDLEADAPRRGMCLCAPGRYAPTTGAVLAVTNDHERLTLKRTTGVRFHVGTFSCNASLKLVDRDDLPPGASAFARIRLEEQVVLAAGDRYIVRALSPMTTVGGGRILSARDYPLKRSAPGVLERLTAARQALDSAPPKAAPDLQAALLAGPRALLSREEAQALTHREEPAAAAALEAAVEAGVLRPLGGVAWMVTPRIEAVRASVAKHLARYHADHPHNWGMEPNLLCETLGLPPQAFKALAKALTAGDEIRIQHGRLALAHHAPDLSAKQIELLETIRARVLAGGMQAPARGTLMKELKIAEADMRLYVRLLHEEGALRVVGVNLVAVPVVDDCRAILEALFATHGVLEIGPFRDATGLARNLAVAMLEYFDREGLTRRVEGGRVWVAKPGASSREAERP